MSTSGSAARIHFQTTISNPPNVDVNYFGACESGSGSGCSVTLPVAFTRMLIPASQTEDIQITARVLNNGTPTNDSGPINVAWASSPDRRSLLLDGPPEPAVLPERDDSTQRRSGQYCLLDDHAEPQERHRHLPLRLLAGQPGAAAGLDRRRRSQLEPRLTRARRRPGTTAAAGGHCIGCHSITNDGKFMGLTIGGSSTYNAANWELLDIQNQDLLLHQPDQDGRQRLQRSERHRRPATRSATGRSTARTPSRPRRPGDRTTLDGQHVQVEALPQQRVAQHRPPPRPPSARPGRRFPARRRPSTPISPIRSGATTAQIWSTPRSTRRRRADSTGNPSGLNGDLKTGGRIAIADADPDAESITDDAHVLVDRQSNITSYYPVHQRGQQLGRLQPEQLRRQLEQPPTSTTTAAPGTARASATATTTRRPGSTWSRPAPPERQLALDYANGATATTTTTTTPGRASAPT